jgi:hypothetical protein
MSSRPEKLGQTRRASLEDLHRPSLNPAQPLPPGHAKPSIKPPHPAALDLPQNLRPPPPGCSKQKPPRHHWSPISSPVMVSFDLSPLYLHLP